MVARSFVAVARDASLAQTHHPLPDEKTRWVHGNPRSAYRLLQIQFILETAPRHSLGSSFRATREAAEESFRGTGRFRTNRSTQILDQGGEEGLLRARASGASEGQPSPAWITGSTLQSLFLTTGSYASAAGSSLLICQENKYTPILLHGSHHFTALMIMQMHIRLHHLGFRIVLSELREEFSILRARQAIKVLYTCPSPRVKSRRTPLGKSRRLLCWLTG
jgi:hypothetical protein